MAIPPTLGSSSLTDPPATIPTTPLPPDTASLPTITDSMVYNVMLKSLLEFWGRLPAQEGTTSLAKIATVPLLVLAGVASIVEGVVRTLLALMYYPFDSTHSPLTAARATKQVLGVCVQAAFTLSLATPNPNPPPAPPVNPPSRPNPAATTHEVAVVDESSPLGLRIATLRTTAERLEQVFAQTTPPVGSSTIPRHDYDTLTLLLANRTIIDNLDRECVALLQERTVTEQSELFSIDVDETSVTNQDALRTIRGYRRRILVAYGMIQDRLIRFRPPSVA